MTEITGFVPHADPIAPSARSYAKLDLVLDNNIGQIPPPMLEQTSTRGPQSSGELRAIAMFADCGDDVLARIFSALQTTRLRARATSVINPTAQGRVGFVWSGRVRLARVSPGGVAVTLYTAERGATLGLPGALLGFTGVGARIHCDTAALILHLPARVLLDAAAECPSLAGAVMTALASQSLDYAARVFELAALDVRARLQAELLRIARRGVWKDGSLIVVDAPTQAALGAQIGAAREAVTRHLRDLSEEGLIIFKRGSIEFPDLKRLQALDKAQAGRAMWSGAASAANEQDTQGPKQTPKKRVE